MAVQWSPEDINSAYNATKEQLANQRRINPQAEAPSAAPTPSVVASADPAATSNLRKPTFSDRIAKARDLTSKAGNLATRGAGALQGVYGVYDAQVNGISSDSVDNATLGVAGALNPAAGLVGNALRPIRDFAAEGITRLFNKDVFNPKSIAGPELQKQISASGGVENLLAKQQAARLNPQPAVPTTSVDTQPIVPAIDTPVVQQASRFTPSGVPVRGTGFIQNSTTGAITELGTPDAPPPPPQRSGLQAYADFSSDYAKAALTTALSNRETKLQKNAATIALEQAKATAANRPKPVVSQPDIQGNITITDPLNRSAVSIKPTVTPSINEFIEAAKKDSRNKKFTPQELEAEYYRLYPQGSVRY